MRGWPLPFAKEGYAGSGGRWSRRISVNHLALVGYCPLQLGKLQPGKVMEVRSRVLRDQLGPKPNQPLENASRHLIRDAPDEMDLSPQNAVDQIPSIAGAPARDPDRQTGSRAVREWARKCSVLNEARPHTIP